MPERQADSNFKPAIGDANSTSPRVSASPRPRFSPSPALPVSPSLFSRWRNAFFGTLLVLAGLAAALVSVLARQTNDSRLTTAGALLSLIFAGFILVFIVPPLARSARLEMAGLDLPI
ncbi:MAG: DUF1772 domain-containing protein [Acidobacteriota bacterium]|nr:DUF1772 domain-containing protein [Acidobacteriota bacterium]